MIQKEYALSKDILWYCIETLATSIGKRWFRETIKEHSPVVHEDAKVLRGDVEIRAEHDGQVVHRHQVFSRVVRDNGKHFQKICNHLQLCRWKCAEKLVNTAFSPTQIRFLRIIACDFIAALLENAVFHFSQPELEKTSNVVRIDVVRKNNGFSGVEPCFELLDVLCASGKSENAFESISLCFDVFGAFINNIRNVRMIRICSAVKEREESVWWWWKEWKGLVC